MVAAAATLMAACAPASVQLRPGSSCDSSPDGLKLCRDQCDANQARACYRVGWFYETGQEVGKSIKTALDHYQRSCDLNFAVACRALGQMYWSGDEVKRNPRKAIEFYRKACTLGIPEACPTRSMVARSEGRRPGPGDDVAVETAAGYAPGAPDQPDSPDAPDVNTPQAPEAEVPSAPGISIP
jgi:TPR repeat protein